MRKRSPEHQSDPINPMNKNWPAPARLRFVVEPKAASAPNIPAVTTNVVAIEAGRYRRAAAPTA